MAETFSFEEAVGETFSFDEAVGQKPDRDASVPLPHGMKPSTAGAGRGLVVPPTAEEQRREEAKTGARKGTMRGVTPFGAGPKLAPGQDPLPSDIEPSSVQGGRGTLNPHNATVRSQDKPFLDKQEALDEAVNLIDEGVPREQVYRDFEQGGSILRSEIEQHGLVRGSDAFKAKVNAGSVRAGAQEGSIQATPTPKRNLLAYANDTVINAANAGARLAKTADDLVRPGGSAGKRIEAFVKAGQRSQSEWQKQKRFELQESLANADGELDKAGQYLYHAIVEDPLNTLAEAAGNIGPFALLGRAISGLKAGQITAASMSVAGAATAGEVRGNIWDRIHLTKDAELRKESPEYRALRNSGMEEGEAKREIGSNLLRNLPELVAAGAIGALGGKFGLEAIATGAKVSTGRVSAAMVGLIDEASQGAVEQLATNVGVQRGLPGQKLTQDVLQNAVAEGISGLVGGALAGGNARELAAQMKYERAAESGFNIQPPLTTDAPDVQVAARLTAFKALSAQFGIPESAVKLATEATDGMPAEKVGPFLKELTAAYERRGIVANPVDPVIADTLDAPPVAPEVEEDTTRETSSEDDGTGLSESAVSNIESTLKEAGALPDDLVTADEQPYGTRAGAVARSTREGGGEVVEVPGGWVVRKADDGAPPPARGMVRAYHGGSSSGQSGPRWFTTDLPYAEGYARKSDGEVSYVDIPEDHPARGGDQSMGVMPTPNFQLPEEIARQRKPLKKKATSGPKQPDVQPAPGVAPRTPGREGNQPAGSGGTVGQLAPDPGRGREASTETLAPSVRAPEPVGVRDKGPAPVGRVIARIGSAPKQAEPLELRENKDGSLTAWLGGYEVLNFETAEPVTVPKGTTDQVALEAVKKSGALGRRMKVFGLDASSGNPQGILRESSGNQGTTATAVEATVPDAPSPLPDAKPTATTATTTATKPEEPAFANDYAKLDGKTFDQQVQVASTGKIVSLRIDAANAMRGIDKRMQLVRELRNCITGSA